MRAQNNTQGGRAPAKVGIDLGTCYSRVAVWQAGDVLIIPNERGRLATPSCVAFTDTCVLVGEAAQEQADTNPANTIFAPQRLIGDTFANPWIQCYMKQWPSSVVRSEDDKPLIRVRDRGKERLLRPEEIVTLLLVNLRKYAERFLGVTVMEAVVTVPARYGRYQREAIVAACRGARLNVLDLVKSPTSSAIAYSLTNRDGPRRNVLVCNMGGSYFDFALLGIEDVRLVERAIGTDFVDLDGCLVRFCMRDLLDKHDVGLASKPVALQRLRRACELAKRKLSQFSQAKVEVSAIVDGFDYMCNMSRPHFEDLCKEDIGSLLDPVLFCLEDVGIEKADVHEVVLVGGAARVPMLRRAIRELFYGKVPREVLRPDHAAVLGAAAYAAALAKRQTAHPNPPAELKGLQVTEVCTWATLSSENLVISPAVNDEETRFAEIDDGMPDSPAYDELVPVTNSLGRAPFIGKEEAPDDGVAMWPNKSRQVSASHYSSPGRLKGDEGLPPAGEVLPSGLSARGAAFEAAPQPKAPSDEDTEGCVVSEDD
eukprot:CAMPEP_0117562462 /NCGR_PEP_ID=MMETSP0784-20121206/54969_1 /TAXON_ID=39447 /ORGANISM="" /LENGTH=539 /DNA_ID=CAMNT_0005360033 /DNA_START=136 /DNA_END=1755 /DNA_ORIENTATION=+